MPDVQEYTIGRWTFFCDGKHLVVTEDFTAYYRYEPDGIIRVSDLSGYTGTGRTLQQAIYRMLCEMYRAGVRWFAEADEYYSRKEAYRGNPVLDREVEKGS